MKRQRLSEMRSDMRKASGSQRRKTSPKKKRSKSKSKSPVRYSPPKQFPSYKEFLKSNPSYFPHSRTAPKEKQFLSPLNTIDTL